MLQIARCNDMARPRDHETWVSRHFRRNLKWPTQQGSEWLLKRDWHFQVDLKPKDTNPCLFAQALNYGAECRSTASCEGRTRHQETRGTRKASPQIDPENLFHVCCTGC